MFNAVRVHLRVMLMYVPYATVLKTKVHVHDKISSSIFDHNKFIQSIEISINNYMYLCSVIILGPYFYSAFDIKICVSFIYF